MMKIDGVSILDYQGASRLADTEHKSSLHVTVLREGKEIDFVLQPPK